MREALRVGRRVFLTTPNRWFPVELHTRLPGRPLAAPCARRSRVRPGGEVLGQGEPPARGRRSFRSLFPAPVELPQPRHDARGDDVTARFPRVALLVLVVGLALHNLAMALLWQAGVREHGAGRRGGLEGRSSSSWRSSLALAAAGSIPHLVWADRLALAYGAIVVAYWLLPQSWLDGGRDGAGASCTRCVTTSCRSAHTSSGASLPSTAPGGGGSSSRSSGSAPGSRSSGSSTSTSCRSSGGATPASPIGSASSSGSPTAASRTCLRTGSSTRTRRAPSGGSSRPS